jgi:23S rRNA pseudouridine1911/1915/1917 synthase
MAIENDLLEQEEQDLYEHLRIIVDKGQSLLRIDKFLMHRVENASRNRIQNAMIRELSPATRLSRLM